MTLHPDVIGRECLVMFEATDRFDVTLRYALARADIAHARVNPEQARHFARSVTFLKLDRRQ